MAQVGIRELKTNLSRYLREVQRGKPIYVTDRGEVIAQITTLDGPSTSKAPSARLAASARWRALVERGVIRPATRRNRSWTKGPLVRAKAGTARRLLDADREE